MVRFCDAGEDFRVRARSHRRFGFNGKVAPGSPADKQRIQVGDEIIEAAGKKVPGAKANDLKPLLEKEVGEVLHLRLKRSRGEIYSANLTAVKRP